MDDLTCSDHFDTYGDSVYDGVTYWVFQAVRGMHGKFNELNRRITKSTLISELLISNMVDDFDGNEEDSSLTYAILAAVFTMANGAVSPAPVVVRPAKPCASPRPFRE